MRNVLLIIVLLFVTSVSAMAQGTLVKNSLWDGSVYQIKEWHKDHLKDPDSVQYINWSPVKQLSNGNYIVRVKYRAKNSFGGYVVNNDFCGLTVLGDVIACVDYDQFVRFLEQYGGE